MPEPKFLNDAGLQDVELHIHAFRGVPDGGSYDRTASLYDKVVGHPVYNRLVWGVPVSAYADAVRTVLDAAPPGALLDVGCGTLCFTAEAYLVATDRPLVLVDRSLAMLRIARNRLVRAAGRFPDHITLVCADAAALRDLDRRYAAAVSWGVHHVLTDGSWLYRFLAQSLQPGGFWTFSSLVTDRAVGAAYLRLLARSGEVAAQRSSADVSREIQAFGLAHQCRRIGSMAFFEGQSPPD